MAPAKISPSRTQARGDGGVVDGEPAQQHGRHQGHLGGEAGIALEGAPVGERRQGEHAHRDHRQQQLAAGDDGHGAAEGRDREGADAGRRPARPRALAPLAVDADQQADPEGHGKIEDERADGRHGATVSPPRPPGFIEW